MHILHGPSCGLLQFEEYPPRGYSMRLLTLWKLEWCLQRLTCKCK